jgi:hypothetical protein
MTSIYEQVAEDLFRAVEDLASRTGRRRIVSLAFVELAGDRCCDMLNAIIAKVLVTLSANLPPSSSSHHLLFGSLCRTPLPCDLDTGRRQCIADECSISEQSTTGVRRSFLQ